MKKMKIHLVDLLPRVPIQDGSYDATWSGNHVTIDGILLASGVPIVFHTGNLYVRGIVPCIVTVIGEDYTLISESIPSPVQTTADSKPERTTPKCYLVNGTDRWVLYVPTATVEKEQTYVGINSMGQIQLSDKITQKELDLLMMVDNTGTIAVNQWLSSPDVREYDSLEDFYAMSKEIREQEMFSTDAES